MKYYTKEWHNLFEALGTADLFEPVLDKHYTDEEIEDLYQEMMDKYVQEEHDNYDEPPYFITDEQDEIDPDDFDPEDYLVGDIDEDGNEFNLHHPADLRELLEFEKKEMEAELREYENRPPFDEEEARREFEEDYRDNLEEPDEDIPQWVRDEVDPRLIAMGVLPEGVYKKLMAQEEKMQERFDALDEAADEALEEMYAQMPDEYTDLLDDMDNLDGDYVTGCEMSDGDLTVTLAGWDEDGEDVINRIVMSDAEIIEDEGLSITSGTDEDGDIESDCDLLYHEVYWSDDRFEVHMMFENHGLRYLTVRCGSLSIEQEHIS